MRVLQRKGPKTPLLVECEDGITTNEDEQLKKITQFFSSVFMNQNAENFIDISPCKMKEPFTLE